MKTPQIRQVIVSILSIAIIVAFVYYLYLNADQYLRLLQISVMGVVMLVLLSLLISLLNGMINVLMFRSLGANLSQREGFYLAAASTLANQLPISGGIVTRSVYLKHRYGLSYTKNFSATLALFACSIAAYGFLGVAILAYWYFTQHVPPSPILFIGFGGMAAGLLIFLLPLDKIRIPDFLLRWLDQAVEGWTVIGRNPQLLAQLLGLQTSTMLLMAARYWLAFHMVSQNVTVGQVILFASASILTQLVSFAPGGLGVREAIVGGIAAALGFDAAVSLFALALDRLVSTVVIVVLGWISMVSLGNQIADSPIKPEEQEP